MAYRHTHTGGELLVGVVLAYAVLSPGGGGRVQSCRRGGGALRHAGGAARRRLAACRRASYSTNLFGGITAINALLTAG